MGWQKLLSRYEEYARRWATEHGWNDQKDIDDLMWAAEGLAKDAADRAIAEKLAQTRNLDDLARIAVVLRDLPDLKEKYFIQLVARGRQIRHGMLAEVGTVTYLLEWRPSWGLETLPGDFVHTTSACGRPPDYAFQIISSTRPLG